MVIRNDGADVMGRYSVFIYEHRDISTAETLFNSSNILPACIKRGNTFKINNKHAFYASIFSRGRFCVATESIPVASGGLLGTKLDNGM
ncbi:hypothetical protein [Marinobacterium sp. LSUCC0821]|uniref:hypothetical protein n=1 Tax=Marinobacterium sp. LSUCC0821 TaxID=2668067 RepID=UPI0014529EAF|nr:hypothetical protein [Marinobacterium sp. LSUCC0821]QJD71999.1 hypothetical protein HH196_09970 [Marinobacterium sp. LSUCC0821]